MIKKIVIGLIIAIIIVASIVGFLFWRGSNKSTSVSNDNAEQEEVYYGNRGNITQAEKIKFLSKNDEYLVGMIGLPVQTELTNFSNDNMIQFALNIAVQRYSNMLTEKKDTKTGTTSYLVPTKVVNQITEEYFGVSEVTFDQTTNPYYSKSNKAFLYTDNIEKTLYYYPVDMTENSETGNTEITVDAIFIADDKEEAEIESARYEGKYQQENVDNTVKLVFDSEGNLVSYQYL